MLVSTHSRRGMILALIIAAAGLSACSKKLDANEIETHRVKDLTITLLNGGGDLKQGRNDFLVQFRSAATNQPIDVGRVQIASTMSMPGMSPMSAGIDLEPTGETGRYRAKGDFAMSGAWRFTVNWDGPAGRGTATFNNDVR